MDDTATLALLLDRVVDGGKSAPTPRLPPRSWRGRAFRRASSGAAPGGGRPPWLPVEAARVRTAPGYAEAWRAYAEAGWAGVTAPEAAGGQGLPMVLAAAVPRQLHVRE